LLVAKGGYLPIAGTLIEVEDDLATVDFASEGSSVTENLVGDGWAVHDALRIEVD
jgi:hypothetical protein